MGRVLRLSSVSVSFLVSLPLRGLALLLLLLPGLGELRCVSGEINLLFGLGLALPRRDLPLAFLLRRERRRKKRLEGAGYHVKRLAD